MKLKSSPKLGKSGNLKNQGKLLLNGFDGTSIPVFREITSDFGTPSCRVLGMLIVWRL
jgi:hypothetical protein